MVRASRSLFAIVTNVDNKGHRITIQWFKPVVQAEAHRNGLLLASDISGNGEETVADSFLVDPNFSYAECVAVTRFITLQGQFGGITAMIRTEFDVESHDTGSPERPVLNLKLVAAEYNSTGRSYSLIKLPELPSYDLNFTVWGWYPLSGIVSEPLLSWK